MFIFIGYVYIIYILKAPQYKIVTYHAIILFILFLFMTYIHPAPPTYLSYLHYYTMYTIHNTHNILYLFSYPYIPPTRFPYSPTSPTHFLMYILSHIFTLTDFFTCFPYPHIFLNVYSHTHTHHPKILLCITV